MSDEKLLIGGAAIASRVFGDPEKSKAVYRLRDTAGLPAFKLGGMLCARPEKLDAWLKEQEAAALVAA